MRTPSAFEALGAMSLILACCSAQAQAPPGASESGSGEQLEADYRVIAARCGSPAWEKAFFKESQAAVRAGVVSRRGSPEEVEKRIVALRRNPLVLVGAAADCPAQLARLKDIQKARKDAIKAVRRH